MDVEKMLVAEAAESARARSLEDRDVGALTKAANQGTPMRNTGSGFALLRRQRRAPDVAEAARWWGRLPTRDTLGRKATLW